MSEPAQKPGRSKQDYGSPIDLVRAAEFRWSPFHTDLAAHDNGDNAKAPRWIGPSRDSLTVDWVAELAGEAGWLNPEFGDIEPWARKCSFESNLGARIVMLTPAGIGTEWFAKYVFGHALVIGIRPRPVFEVVPAPELVTPQLGLFARHPDAPVLDGQPQEGDAFPKDMMLTVWGYGPPGFEVWRWRA